MTWFSRAAPRAAAREGVKPPSRAEEVARAVPSAGSVRGVCVWRGGEGSRGRARAEGRAGVLKAWAVPRGRRPGSAARAERAARLVRAAEQGTSARASTTRPVNKRVETVPGDSAPKRKADQWTRALGQRRTSSNPWPRRKTSANPG